MDYPRARLLRTRKLGVLLQNARQQAGQSRRALAQALGVSSGQLRAYEEGRKAPSLPELEALAYVLRVPLEHFWGDKVLEAPLPPQGEPLPAGFLPLRQQQVAVLLQQKREDAGVSATALARQVALSPRRLQAYEHGERPVPLPVLEDLTNALGVPMEHFMDRTGPVGRWRMQQRQVAQFLRLPDDLREFVAQPVNKPYLELAQRLSAMSADHLRSIAESLLEITL